MGASNAKGRKKEYHPVLPPKSRPQAVPVVDAEVVVEGTEWAWTHRYIGQPLSRISEGLSRYSSSSRNSERSNNPASRHVEAGDPGNNDAAKLPMIQTARNASRSEDNKART